MLPNLCAGSPEGGPCHSRMRFARKRETHLTRGSEPGLTIEIENRKLELERCEQRAKRAPAVAKT
jgi:hypothetical protein